MPTLQYHRTGGLPIVDAVIRYHPLNGKSHPSGKVPEVRVRALIDTGATHVVVQPHLIAQLSLPFASMVNNTVVGGTTHSVPGHAADIVFGSLPSFTVTDVLVLGQNLSGFDMLIGWDALRFTDWQFLQNGQFSQSW